eukprot:741659-Heterocapsa_arctica.AAC.1
MLLFVHEARTAQKAIDSGVPTSRERRATSADNGNTTIVEAGASLSDNDKQQLSCLQKQSNTVLNND